MEQQEHVCRHCYKRFVEEHFCELLKQTVHSTDKDDLMVLAPKHPLLSEQ